MLPNELWLAELGESDLGSLGHVMRWCWSLLRWIVRHRLLL